MKTLFTGLLILLAINMTAKSEIKIGFEVSFTEPQAHYIEMEMNISGIIKDYIDVKMPVWTPGSYLIREFAKNIEGFEATADGKAIRFEKVKKNSWRVYSAHAKNIKIRYRIYAFEISVRTAFVDQDHAFLSGASIFMYPDGFLKSPSTVTIKPFKGWSKVSTGLEPLAMPFTYHASNFDVLYDSPFEVGNQDTFEFTASGVKHEVAMYGGGNYDKEKLKVDMARIVEQATAIYGENPNKHYTFIVHNLAENGGGIEHLNSTVLGASRNAYATAQGYKGFLGLVAHEYHHLWNVKRLRPIALGPFDYENENYTTDLWIAEGFTSYFENKFMFRAGFFNLQETVQTLANAVAGIINSPGSEVQSASAASYDAWIKAYRPNENSNNATVSYYNKGAVIGLLMDLEIVHASKGTKSLDDVMKAMYLKYYKKLGRGYTDAEFKAMAEEISGISFTGFWDKYVNGTDPVAYQKYFGYAGITVVNENEGKIVPYLGAASSNLGGDIFITAVSRNSAAWIGGINVNDEVISVDSIPIEAVIERMPAITSKNVGDKVTIRVRRDSVIRDITVTLKANPNVKLKAGPDAGATEKQVQFRKKWL